MCRRGRVGAVTERCFPVAGCLLAIMGSAFAVTGRLFAVMPAWLQVLPIGGLFVMRLQPRCACFFARHRRRATFAARMRPRQKASVVTVRIATGCEIIVGCVLIVISGSLIVIRSSLVASARRLVTI